MIFATRYRTLLNSKNKLTQRTIKKEEEKKNKERKKMTLQTHQNSDDDTISVVEKISSNSNGLRLICLWTAPGAHYGHR